VRAQIAEALGPYKLSCTAVGYDADGPVAINEVNGTWQTATQFSSVGLLYYVDRDRPLRRFTLGAPERVPRLRLAVHPRRRRGGLAPGRRAVTRARSLKSLGEEPETLGSRSSVKTAIPHRHRQVFMRKDERCREV